MCLIVGQLSIKVEWRDAPLALRDFSRSNKLKLSANATIGLHSHPHLQQSIYAILSCCVTLISSSDTECFFLYLFLFKKIFFLDVMSKQRMTLLDNQIKFFHMIFKMSFQWKKMNAFLKRNNFFIFSLLKSIIKHNKHF